MKLAAVELGLPELEAERVILAVVRALEQRLPVDEMTDLASQLPRRCESYSRVAISRSASCLPRDIGHAEFLALVASELELTAMSLDAFSRSSV